MSFKKLMTDTVTKERKTSPRTSKKARAVVITDINGFMKKLETSDSFAAQHLKDKLFVKGKYKHINKERVIRVIRDTLDIINE